MLAADSITHSLKELQQLLQVRRMRVDAAQVMVRNQRLVRDQASAELHRLRELEQRHKDELLGFREHLAGEGAQHTFSMGAMVGPYLDSLAQAVISAEGDVLRGDKVVASAQDKLAQCLAIHRRELARHDAIEEAIARAKRANGRIQLSREEEDVGDMRRPVGLLTLSTTARKDTP
ncbi:MAG: hypothetical protein H7Y33_17005 [Cytophagales bacterium]|nr:hypothetical protein [Rhizobacter sp.]